MFDDLKAAGNTGYASQDNVGKGRVAALPHFRRQQRKRGRIQGLAAHAETSDKRHIITSAIEQKAVLATVKAMGRRASMWISSHPGRLAAEKILRNRRSS